VDGLHAAAGSIFGIMRVEIKGVRLEHEVVVTIPM
jgi:hypothetical protein